MRTIGLLSNGGSILGAILIGEFIHQNGWRTFVGNGCYSACALIWLAGAERRMRTGAIIGFHAVAEDGRESGSGNAIVGSYLTRLGYSYDLIAFATEASPADMAILTPEKAKSLGINMVVTKPPPAQPSATAPPAQPSATTPAIAQQRSQDDLSRKLMETGLAVVLRSYPGATNEGTGDEIKVRGKVFTYIIPKDERPALCILIPTKPKGELRPACARLSLENISIAPPPPASTPSR